MDIITLLPVLMFLALAVLLFSGFPVAFVLGGVGLAFGFIGIQLDVFNLIEFFNILLTSETASKSPGDAIGKPASIISIPSSSNTLAI